MVQDAVEGGVPGQVAEDHQAGITFGRVPTVAKGPLGVDVRHHKGEVGDHVAE